MKFVTREVEILVAMLDTEYINKKDLAFNMGVSVQALNLSLKILTAERPQYVFEHQYALCPHCKKELTDIPMKKSSYVLSLTVEGKEQAEKMKKLIDAL